MWQAILLVPVVVISVVLLMYILCILLIGYDANQKKKLLQATIVQLGSNTTGCSITTYYKGKNHLSPKIYFLGCYHKPTPLDVEYDYLDKYILKYKKDEQNSKLFIVTKNPDVEEESYGVLNYKTHEYLKYKNYEQLDENLKNIFDRVGFTEL